MNIDKSAEGDPASSISESLRDSLERLVNAFESSIEDSATDLLLNEVSVGAMFFSPGSTPSEASLNCRDFGPNCSRALERIKSFAPFSAKALPLRMLKLKLALGLDGDTWGKLKFTEPIGRTKRILHHIKCLELAVHLNKALDAAICDVDGKHDVIFPRKSDISLLVKGPEGHPVFFLIDVTSKTSVGPKLEALESQARAFSLLHGVPALPVVVSMHYDESSISNSMEGVIVAEDISVHALHERALDVIGFSLQNSNESEKMAFAEVLASVVDESVDTLIRQSVEAPNDQSDLMKELKTLWQIMSTYDSKFEKKIVDHSTAWHSDNAQFLRHLCDVSRRSGLSRASEFLQLPVTVPLMLDFKHPLKNPPYLICPNESVRTKLYAEICKRDPLMAVVNACFEDNSESAFLTGKFVMYDLSTRPCPEEFMKHFNAPQRRSTPLPHGCMGAYRRLRRKVLRRGVLDPPPQNSGNVPIGKTSEVDIEDTVIEPGAQFLFSMDYLKDKRFEKFLSRHEGHKDTRSEPMTEISEIQGKFDALAASDDMFRAMLEAFTPDQGEASRRAKASYTFADKVDLLSLQLGKETLKHLWHDCRLVTDNAVVDYLDERYNAARGLSSSMQSSRPANYGTLLNSGVHLSWTFCYINSPATNFRSTWQRKIGLASNMRSSFSRKANVSGVGFMAPIESLSLPVNVDSMSSFIVNMPDDSCSIMSSGFQSIDKNQLEWDLMALPRCIAKMTSVYEHRRDLYRSKTLPLNADTNLIRNPTHLGRLEAVTQALGFTPNSQQMSVIYESTRYLHQAVSSVDCDHSSVLKKMEGVRVKNMIEVSSASRIMIPYVLSVMRKASKGLNSLKGGTREVHVLLGDLLLASSDPSFNVGLYAISSQLNDVKFNRKAAEAACVEAIWKSEESLLKTKASHPELYESIPKSLSLALSLEQMASSGVPIPLTRISEILVENQEEIQNFHAEFGKVPAKMPYISSSLFEILCYLRLRFEMGPIDSVRSFVGQQIEEYFTTKGSHLSHHLNEAFPLRAFRKVSAMLAWVGDILQSTFLGEPPDRDPKSSQAIDSIAGQETLRDLIDSEHGRDIFIDNYTLFLAFVSGVAKDSPVIQLSQKDARGKDREISTLFVGYSVRNILCEKLAMPLSKRTPEDIIMEENKEVLLSRVVGKAVRAKSEADSQKNSIVFINQDKSSFGPNKKFSSFLCYSMCLAPDLETYRFLKDTFMLGKHKQIRYPHELLKSSIGTAQYDENGELLGSNIPSFSFKGPSSKTVKIMAQINEQFNHGNSHGAVGTDWTSTSEGMPGQGIMGISSSLQHAAILRDMCKRLKRLFDWDVKALANSDDSMATNEFPKSSSEMVRLKFRNVNLRYLSLAGLIDNSGKFSMTTEKGEMTSIFFINDSPCVPVEKFAMAFTHLCTTADFPQDILKAASSAGDLARKGATFFMSQTLAFINMVQVIDAHRFWTIYLPSLEGTSPGPTHNSIQAFGLPEVDAINQILNPMAGMFKASHSWLIGLEDKAAAWALNHLLSKPSEETFEGDVNSSMGIAEVSDRGLGGGTYVRPKSYWGLSGLRGMLRRPKGTLRLARELSTSILSLRDRSRMAFMCPDGSLSAGVSKVLTALSNPIDRGDADKPSFLQHADLTHSYTRRVLHIRPGSPLAEIVGATLVSRKELKEALSRPETSEILQELHMKEIMNSGEVKVNDLEIASCISSSISSSLRLANHSSNIRLNPNGRNHVTNEFDPESSALPESKYRVVKLGQPGKLGIDLDSWASRAASELSADDEWKSMDLKVLRSFDIYKGKGSAPLEEAVASALNARERLKSLLSPNSQAMIRLPPGVYSSGSVIMSWIKENTLLGCKARIRDEYALMDELFRASSYGRQVRRDENPSLLNLAISHGESLLTMKTPPPRALDTGLGIRNATSVVLDGFSGVSSLRVSFKASNASKAMTELGALNAKVVATPDLLLTAFEVAAQTGYKFTGNFKARALSLSLSQGRPTRIRNPCYLIRSQPLQSDEAQKTFRHDFVCLLTDASTPMNSVSDASLWPDERTFFNGIASNGLNGFGLSGTEACHETDLYTFSVLSPGLLMHFTIDSGSVKVACPGFQFSLPICLVMSPLSLRLNAGHRFESTVVDNLSLKGLKRDVLDVLDRLRKLTVRSFSLIQPEMARPTARRLCQLAHDISDNPRSLIEILNSSLADFVSSGMVKLRFVSIHLTAPSFSQMNDDSDNSSRLNILSLKVAGSWGDEPDEVESDLPANSKSGKFNDVAIETFNVLRSNVDKSELRAMCRSTPANGNPNVYVVEGMLDFLEATRPAVEDLGVEAIPDKEVTNVDDLAMEETVSHSKQIAKALKRAGGLHSVFKSLFKDLKPVSESSKIEEIFEMYDEIDPDDEVKALLPRDAGSFDFNFDDILND